MADVDVLTQSYKLTFGGLVPVCQPHLSHLAMLFNAKYISWTGQQD